MSLSVDESLQTSRSRLREKLSANAELCNVLMALLSRLILMAKYKGTPVQGVRMGPITEMGKGGFRSHITFLPVQLLRPILLERRNDFSAWMAARNISLAEVLDANKSVGDFFQALIERIDRWAERRRIPFTELIVPERKAFISPDDDLILRVAKQTDRNEMLEHQLGGQAIAA